MPPSINFEPQPTLVLIHGFLDSSATWSLLVEELSECPVECIIPDLRGAGSRAGSGGPFTLDQAVEDVLHFTGPERRNLVFIGHSMGAQIAELAAQRASDRTSALVLITPSPLQGKMLADDARALLRQAGGSEAAQRQIRKMFSANLPEQFQSPPRETMMGVEAVEGYYDAFTVGTASGLRPALFDGPVLLIGANEDPVITPDLVRSIHQTRFPLAELALIDDSGHWPQAEQPAAVGREISRFLGLTRP